MNPESDAAAPAATDLPEGWLRIESLDIEAQGVAHRPDGKVVFVEGALPGELVSVNVHRRKNNWEAATLTELHSASSQRVRPRCPHFGLHAGGGDRLVHDLFELAAVCAAGTEDLDVEHDQTPLSEEAAARRLATDSSSASAAMKPAR